MKELIIHIKDSRGSTSIKYTQGIHAIEYNAECKKLSVVLDRGYVCEDRSKLTEFNASCEPFRHLFYDVEYIAAS